MSTQPEAANPEDLVMQPFMNFWSTYMQQVNGATKNVLESLNGSMDPQVWRQHWLDAVSHSFEAYMRSPAYLEMMKHNMETMVQAKGQANDLSKELARTAGIPTVSDISGLFERLHSIEEKILARLNHIDEQLNAIDSRFQNTNNE